MHKKIKLIGWQSWSDCRHPHSAPRPRYLSPHGKNISEITMTSSSRRRSAPPTGWSSWSAFGPRINENVVLRHADWMLKNQERIPLKYLLIDDGWTSKWGDWLDQPPVNFPRGLPWIAKAITSRHLEPGLWLSPFLIHSHSRLVHSHPDWLIRNSKGKLIDGSFNNPFDRFRPHPRWILDLSLTPVQKYLNQVLDYITASGFSLIKLDFLYAQHFNPTYRDSVTPDRLLRNFLTGLKTRYPRLHLNASGCPLLPAAGIVDSIRISEDLVYPQLRRVAPLNSLIHSTRLRQLSANLQARYPTHSIWYLDPDAFVCDPAFGFTHRQINELQHIIRRAAGVKFLGDNLTTLSSERIKKYILPLFSGSPV